MIRNPTFSYHPYLYISQSNCSKLLSCVHMVRLSNFSPKATAIELNHKVAEMNIEMLDLLVPLTIIIIDNNSASCPIRINHHRAVTSYECDVEGLGIFIQHIIKNTNIMTDAVGVRCEGQLSSQWNEISRRRS